MKPGPDSPSLKARLVVETDMDPPAHPKPTLFHGDVSTELIVSAPENFAGGEVSIFHHPLSDPVIQAGLDGSGNGSELMSATIDITKLHRGYFSAMVARKDGTYEVLWFVVARPLQPSPNGNAETGPMVWQPVEDPAPRLVGYWAVEREDPAPPSVDGRTRHVIEKGVAEFTSQGRGASAAFRFEGEEATQLYQYVLMPRPGGQLLQLVRDNTTSGAVCSISEDNASANLKFELDDSEQPSPDSKSNRSRRLDVWTLNRIDRQEYEERLSMNPAIETDHVGKVTVQGTAERADANGPSVELAEIKKAWTQRSKDVSTSRLRWTENRIYPRGEKLSPNEPEPLAADLTVAWEKKLIIAGDKCRLEGIGKAWDFRVRQMAPFEFTAVRNENGRSYHNYPDKTDNLGYFSESLKGLADVTYRPALLGTNPGDPEFGRIDLADYHFVPGVTEINGQKCIKLESNDDRSTDNQLFLDPERQFVVTRSISSTGAQVMRQLDLNYKQDSRGIWYPASWQFQILNGNLDRHAIHITVVTTEFESDFAASPADFEIHYRPGTLIYDQRTRGKAIKIRVQEDGSHQLTEHEGVSVTSETIAVASDNGATEDQDSPRAVAALRELGAELEFNGDKQVTSVTLGLGDDGLVGGTTDAQLVHLKGLHHLQSLAIAGHEVTDQCTKTEGRSFSK